MTSQLYCAQGRFNSLWKVLYGDLCGFSIEPKANGELCGDFLAPQRLSFVATEAL